MNSKMLLLLLLVTLSGACLFACMPDPDTSGNRSPEETNQPSAPEVIALPTPQVRGEMTLEETLSTRRSVRNFTDQALTEAEIGQLLWAAQGITDPAGLRTSPSAGALYPLELYAVTSEGVYHYEPQGHRLRLHQPGNVRTDLYEAALRQEAVRKAPAVFVIAAVYERTAKKYGAERSPRYVHMEAGHAGQNLLLQAVALGLGAVPIGAFYDEQVKESLDLPADQQPLYLIPVGHPASSPDENR